MSGSFRPSRSPNIIWPSLSFIIHYGRQWSEMFTRPKTLNIHIHLWNPNTERLEIGRTVQGGGLGLARVGPLSARFICKRSVHNNAGCYGGYGTMRVAHYVLRHYTLNLSKNRSRMADHILRPSAKISNRDVSPGVALLKAVPQWTRMAPQISFRIIHSSYCGECNRLSTSLRIGDAPPPPPNFNKIYFN